MASALFPAPNATTPALALAYQQRTDTAHGGEPAATVSAPAEAEVAAMISHELRSPLAALRVASELAMEEDEDPERRRELLHVIARQVVRLDRLVQDLADVFRLQAGQLHLKREPLDVAALCAELVADLRSSGRQDRVVLQCDEHLPRIPADRLKIRTVLSNIIGNAIKYGSADGPVTVYVERVADMLRVSVQDTGDGIDAADLPHVFKQGFRASASAGKTKGYGLGLFITRMLVELHGGAIWAESEPDQGSRFTFTLPLLAGPKQDPGEGPSIAQWRVAV